MDARYCLECGARLGAEMRDGRERKRCRTCGWLWLDLPRPVVLVLAVSPSGKVVLTRDERFPPDQWGLVAGYIERDEHPEDAALRELREEAGLIGSNPRFVSADHYRDNAIFCVRCDVADGTVTPEAGTEVRFVAPRLSMIVPDSPASRLVAALLEA